MALWGEYVYAASIVALVGLLVNWGGKELMIREFSAKPNALVQIWTNAVWPRIILAFFGGGIFYFFFPPFMAGACHIWLLFLILNRLWEVWFTYHKSFIWLNLSEFIFWIITLGYVFLSKSLNINGLCILTSFASFAKFLCLILGSKGWGFFPFQVDSIFKNHFLKNGFPFLLLGVVGLAEARLDLFCINYFLDNTSVGKYSIAMSIIMLLKNLPAFFVEPMTKNLYRTSDHTKSKLSNLLFVLGIFISVIGVVVVGFVSIAVFGIKFSMPFYVAAILFVLPRYIFSMDVFLLLQRKKEIVMVTGIAIGLLFHLICNMLFLNEFGIEAAIFSAALGQWVMLVFYKIFIKKL